MMKTILHYFLVLLVAGLTAEAIEDFGEETTTMHGFIDLNEVQPSDSQSSETPDTTMKPSILNELEHVAWKIAQLEWNLTSAIQRRLGGPLVKAIRMRSQAEPALARIIGLVEGGILSNNLHSRK
nr:uncharacterized protein LOC106682810 [Halyomorpha halys]XP_024215214.1 uncharacterized protein LOC106682810 [Halyomorpha halys]